MGCAIAIATDHSYKKAGRQALALERFMASLAKVVVVYADLIHYLQDADMKKPLAAKVPRDLIVPWLRWEKGGEFVPCLLCLCTLGRAAGSSRPSQITHASHVFQFSIANNPRTCQILECVLIATQDDRAGC